MKMLSLFAHPHAVQGVYDFLSFFRKKNINLCEYVMQCKWKASQMLLLHKAHRSTVTHTTPVDESVFWSEIIGVCKKNTM